MNEKGITLIELLVTAGIVVLMTAAGYTFFLDTSKFQARHERQKDMQTNLQIAMEMLVYEIRHAGYGIIDPIPPERRPFGAATTAGLTQTIVPGPGGAGAPDTIGVLRAGTLQLGTLSTAMPEKASTIEVKVVKAIADQSGDLATLQNSIGLITLGGLYTQGVTAITAAGNIFTFTLAQRSTVETFPEGFPVEAVVAEGVKQYSIGAPAGETEQALLEAGVLFAPGIEDLQVVYLLREPGAGGVTETDAPGVLPYSAIRLSLMARVADPDPNWRSPTVRPQVEDHKAGTSTDQFHRAVLTRIVGLPNDRF